MPCTKIDRANKLLTLRDLKNHLEQWLDNQLFKKESQLDGGSKSNQDPWIHFQFTPHDCPGQRVIWKLNGDTKRTAVKSFIDNPTLVAGITEKGTDRLLLQGHNDPDGWFCYRV